MKITVIINPRSGRGKAQSVGQRLQSLLEERGHAVHCYETNEDKALYCEQIKASDRVVIIGGDGTVHHLLSTLIECDTPMYHLGTGTANLICKEFGMSRNPSKVLEHLESDAPATLVDVPQCNGSPFLIMISLGFDASVIHRFQDARKKRGGYRAYLKPIIDELLHPRPALCTIELNSSPPLSSSWNNRCLKPQILWRRVQSKSKRQPSRRHA